MESLETMDMISEGDRRALAALADGSRADPKFAARVAESATLQALLAEQRQALATLTAVRVEAPERLRAAAAEQRPASARRRPAGVLSTGLATAGVIALAIVALLPGSQVPSVARAAALAARGPSQPAPAADPTRPETLRSAVDGVRYPYWEDAFGWRASGARADQISGRSATTVYYTGRSGRRVAYTIVSGSALPEPANATTHQVAGMRLLSLETGTQTIVTWRRNGRTCVLTATGVPVGTLLALAGWRNGGGL